jgi:hypothetical protein
MLMGNKERKKKECPGGYRYWSHNAILVLKYSLDITAKLQRSKK